MSSLGDLPVFVQPQLQMSAATAAKIAAGTAYRIGGVVRDVGTKQIVEHLKDAAPVAEAATQSVRGVARITSKLNLSKVDLTKIDVKTAGKWGGLVLITGAAITGSIWVVQQLKDGEQTPANEVVEELADTDGEDPECLVAFRASLQAYVDAGVEGRLTSEIVGQLAADLTAVETYSSEGAVVFTFEELMPFFELVTAHTPVLAHAYNVEVDEAALKGADVISLRRHLEVQQSILKESA